MDEFDDILLDDYNIDENNASTSNLTTQPEAEETVEDQPKKTKVVLPLDEDLLLDPKGFPLLRSEVQYLEFSGNQGDELHDLDKLFSYYTLWSGKLYPKLQFEDFLKRVTNAASSQRVKVVMDEWTSEFKERKRIREEFRNELSGETVGDADDAPNSAAEEEESSEDDNRPLFFPITKPLPSQPPKKKKKTASQPAKSKKQSKKDDNSDSDEDEGPISTSQQRRVILDDSDDDEEDVHNLNRQSALALILEKKRKREQQQKEEEERRKQKELEELLAEKPADDYEDIQLALSDSELEALNLPPTSSQAPSESGDKEDEFSDNEMIELDDSHPEEQL